jgi:hypothetical protein
MDGDSTKRQSIGKITSGITRGNTLALSTINFVYQQLPNWRDDPDRPDEKSEDKLNLQLCKFLDSLARHDFPMVRFDREEPQTERRRVDLSASAVETTVIGAKPHTIYDPFLVFEGKRLPAPSSDREKEYVTGLDQRTGGIQRFKLRLHGADMSLAAMIGYIQDQTPNEWQKKINEWIAELNEGTIADDCVWNNDKPLKLIDEVQPKGIASYNSIHIRNSIKMRSEIEIFHLWITMNKKQIPKES